MCVLFNAFKSSKAIDIIRIILNQHFPLCYFKCLILNEFILNEINCVQIHDYFGGGLKSVGPFVQNYLGTYDKWEVD